MRSAPSVTSPVGRSRLEARLAWCLWGLGLIELSASALGPSPLGWRQGVGGSVLALCAVVLWLHLRCSPQGHLAWDGLVWRWSGSGISCEVQPEVACDLQRWLLVRLRSRAKPPLPGCPAWLWLQAGADTPHWLSVRRALYSRGPRQAPLDTPTLTP